MAEYISVLPPTELPLMPLREVVMFPRSIAPLFVGREASIKAIENAIEYYDRQIFLVTQRDSSLTRPGDADLFEVGTVSRVLQLLRLPDGTIKVLFEGLYRAFWKPARPAAPEADALPGAEEAQMALVTPLDEESGDREEAAATMRAVIDALDE